MSHQAPLCIFLFSAETQADLRAWVSRIHGTLSQSTELERRPRDLAYTLQQLPNLTERLAVGCATVAQLGRHLDDYLRGRADIDAVFSGRSEALNRPLPDDFALAHALVKAALWADGCFDRWPIERRRLALRFSRSARMLSPQRCWRERAMAQVLALDDFALVAAENLNPTELMLANIWQEVLNLPQRPDRDANFFELGGNSLAAMRTLARISEHSGARLSAATLFRWPTLAQLARHCKVEDAAVPERMVASKETSAPLTFAQERLWFLNRFDRDARAYHLPLEFHLHGALDCKALRGALSVLIERHEPLRTHFPLSGGAPIQLVEGHDRFELSLFDLSELSEERRDRAFLEIARRYAFQAFELERGPLWRAALLRCGEASHTLLFCIHHINFDGWSVGVFLNELRQSYRALLLGTAGLPALRHRYSAFARAQQSDRNRFEERGELDWWRTRLDRLACLDLPSDHPRPPFQDQNGGRIAGRLPASLTGALEALALQQRTTLFSVLQLAYRVLLWRWSGQRDFAIGTPVAGRDQASSEQLVGLFINTLVLRYTLEPEASVVANLSASATATLEAMDHQDVPFELIVRACGQERDHSRSPLVQTLLTLQNAPFSNAPLLGAKSLELKLTPLQSCAFDLALECRVEDGCLLTQWDYATALFEPSTIARMAQQFERLLVAMVAAPTGQLAQLPLISEAELTEIAAWQGERVAVTELLLERFANCAARHGTELAILSESPAMQLTYAALDRRSDALARHLIQLGVCRESRVAVLLPRDARLPLALLAVLKAGAAYVPLDDIYPPERIECMMEDASPSLVLTCASLAKLLPAQWPQWDIDLEISAVAAPDPLPQIESEQCAYLLFTSGSTGRPKGVMISHRALANLLQSMAQAPGLSASDTLLSVTTPCFDIATLELFLPLSIGARLVVADRASTLDRNALLDLLVRHKVTHLQATPATFFLLADACLPKGLRMICGGEALPSELAHKLSAQGELWNVYGPTETTIWSTCTRIDEEMCSVQNGGTMPLGRPIDNTHCHVLDRAGQLVPLGVCGELYIGGLGLARGYHQRAALTAERFLPDPFAQVAGARHYRSGDLVRLCKPGVKGPLRLVYLGRADHQVKLRGFRIEPGDIECALHLCPQVAQAVVRPRKTPMGEWVLIAWLRLHEGASFEREALCKQLRESLPDYMVPGHFAVLERFPQTPNGKVDRSALDALALPSATAEKRNDQVLSPQEALVADVFAEVLGLNELQAEDHFFRCGGHSLSAARAMIALSARCGRELPLRLLFEHPSVAALALALDQEATGETPSLTALGPAPSADVHVLSFPQERLWYLDRLHGPSSTYNLPVAWRVKGRIATLALEQALADVCLRHPSMRTVFPIGAEPCQVILEHATFPVVLVDLSALPSERAQIHALKLAELEADRPFQLSQGPLVRCRLLRWKNDESLVQLNHHHIISDAWSIAIIARDWSTAYLTALEQRAPLWKPLALDASDFAHWQRLACHEGTRERARHWWRQHLAEAAPLDLASDFAKQSHGPRLLKRQALSFPKASLIQVQAACPEATPYMILLAAFAWVLARHSGQAKLVIATAVAGRERPELIDLVGFFVNTLPLALDLTQQQTPLTLAHLTAHVRQNLLDALAHQELPLQEIVRECSGEGMSDSEGLWKVMFVLHNGPAVALDLAGAEAQLTPLSGQRARFDLAVDLMSSADGYEGYLDYNSDLYTAETISRLAQHFQLLLSLLAQAPHAPMIGINLLSVDERHQLIDSFNRTSCPIPSASNVLALILPVLAQEPSLPFIFSGDQQLDRAGFARRLSAMVAQLRACGIGPQQRVAVYLERDINLPIALCAVLASGAAFIPLDPVFPKARIEAILADASPSALITSTTLQDDLQELALPLLLIDAVVANETTGLATLLERRNALESAYIIYTSGSTGSPKGVEICHQALINLLWYMRSALQVTCNDRFLAVVTICFDPAMVDIFLPLMCGARLVVASHNEVRDSASLARLINVHGITVNVNTPPGVRLLLEQEWRANLRITPCGDVLTPDLVQALCARGVTVLNCYGPTETTIFSTTSAVYQRDMEVDIRRAIPIGQPLSNTSTFVLDRMGDLTPMGVPGELYIGGLGLARGYFRAPARTASRFMPNPFASKSSPGTRLYRSGDLVRWSPDGQLIFLGRLDHQVKIRGYRIELGDIEATLCSHPQVKTALVMARGDSKNKRLLGYVIANDATLQLGPLGEWLRTRLPEYMVPTLVLLDQFPVTANGKLDRQALPEPEGPSAQSFIAPRNPFEALIAAQWCAALNCAKVGIHDNFFELGGHSLLAARLAGLITRACGQTLTLADLLGNPSIAALAELLTNSNSQALQAIEPSQLSPGQTCELSSAQERIWFVQQLDPLNVAYNVALGNSVDGALAAAFLEQAIRHVCNRHEALRLTFPNLDGLPLTQLAESFHIDLRVVDLSHFGQDLSDEQALKLGRNETRRPFNIAHAPLVRFLLVRIAPNRAKLWLTLHHLVVDGPSLVILAAELRRAYRQCFSATPLTTPAGPLQYSAVCRWQRHHFAIGNLKHQFDYWCTNLAHAPQLDLPTDKPRPVMMSLKGALHEIRLSPSQSSGIVALARNQKTTPFCLLLGAFTVMLSRYARQEDLVVGTVSANRERPELSDLIGLLINMLPLRLRPERQLSFIEFASQVQQVTNSAFRHHDIPFQILADHLVQGHQPSIPPLFQVMFTLQSEAALELDLQGTECQALLCDTATSKYDLSVSLVQQGDCFAGVLEYNTDLYQVESITRMWHHYETLLGQILSEPMASLTSHSMLNPIERAHLLADLERTATPAPGPASLPDWVTARATSFPDETAVIAGSEGITRAQLEQRSNQLAQRLRELGVGPEVPVAVFLDRSIDLVISLLAVLKSGGYYVPMDPIYPSERLAMMIEDAAPTCVISRPDMLTFLPESAPTVVFPNAPTGQDSDSSMVLVFPDNLAYMLFTSGSTGRPKGVQISHRSLLNFIASMSREPGLLPEDRLLAVTTICFDIAALELYLPLVTGASCVIAEQMACNDAFQLIELLDRHQITAMQATPATWTMLLDAGWNKSLTVLCGGEALPQRLAERLFAAGNRIWNLYGPTETTVWSAITELSSTGTDVEIHLGHAIDNTHIVLLDHTGQLVPVGVPGEVYIGGRGLARGYLGRHALTAERFVPDPFSSQPDARLYRTGDLARYSETIEPSTRLIYMGRADFQVKLRGFRIELGDIESRLRIHPSVAEAVVLARVVSGEQTALVAYVIAHADAILNNDPHLRSRLRHELKRHLHEALPDYMVPSFLVFLERFPLTLNGKINRLALPAPVTTISSNEYEAPQNEAERILAEVWAKLFQRERVGRRDHFYDLGGDSLMVIRMVAMAAQQGMRLHPRDVIGQPRLHVLAKLAQTPQYGKENADAGPLPISPHLCWYLENFDPTHHVWLMAQSMLMRPNFAPQRFSEILYQLLKTHEALRLRVRIQDQEPEARIIAIEAEPLPFDYFDLRTHDPKERESAYEAIALQRHRCLSILDGPVVRLLVFQLDDVQPLRVHLIAHHAICDYYSYYNVLLEDFCILYRQLQKGEKPNLMPTSSGYRDWSASLHYHAKNQALQQDKDWWLSPARSKQYPLPCDFDCRIHRVGEMVQLHQDLDAQLSRELLQAAAALSLGVEIFLLAALARGFCAWSDQEGIRLDVEHHGRSVDSQLDLSRTLGALTTKYPLVLQPGQLNTDLWLQQVAHELHDAPHQGRGFGILRYLCKDEASAQLARVAASEIFFNYRGRVAGGLSPTDFAVGEHVDCGHPDDPVSYLLILNSQLSEDQLALSWLFSACIHRSASIEALADHTRRALITILEQVAVRT